LDIDQQQRCSRKQWRNRVWARGKT